MNGYEVYCHYMAMKLHFTSSYDYFKYNGRVKTATPDAFDRRRDKYMFHKLARKLKDDEVIPFLLSNFLVHQKAWTKQLLEPEAFDTLRRWQKISQSFNYTFEMDLRRIQTKTTLTDSIQVREDGYPEILNMIFQKEISMETLCAIHAMTGCINAWDRQYKDDYIYSGISLLIRKYLPFLSLNLTELKKIVKTVLTDA